MAAWSDSAEIEQIRERLKQVPDPLAFLATALAHAPVPVQIYKADGHCLFTNPAFRALFGSEPPPEYNVLEDELLRAQGKLELVHRAFRGETVHVPPIWYDARELQQVKVEGKRVAVSATFFPIPDASGAVGYVGMVFQDLTEALSAREGAEAGQQAEEQARRRFEFLAAVSEVFSSSLDHRAMLRRIAELSVPAIADWVTMVVEDERGVMRRTAVVHRDASKAELCRRYECEFPPTQHRAGSHGLVFGERRGVLVEEVTSEFLARTSQSADHLELMRGLGVSSCVMVPLEASGRAVGVISLMTGVSGRRFGPDDLALAEEIARRASGAIENAHLFHQVQAARAEAEQASRAKDEFLAMLGHELRNPLAPITTAIQLMKLKGEGRSSREQAVIQRQVEHLTRLVDDLLDVSRVARGKVQLKRSAVEASTFIAKAVEMASPLLEQREVRLTLEVPSSGLAVFGDEVRLAQVISNFLTNAAKYTEPGGSVTVTAAEENGQVVIRVGDTGMGIDSELLPRIFDLFVQGPQGKARSAGGLGLGLSLVKSLAELHGGMVSAHSEGPGRGSEFTVRFPAIRRGELPELPPSSVEPAPRPARPEGMRVLVVDDNLDAADVLAEFLRAEGHQVEVAYDALSALERLADFDAEVAILDIGLPVMDGYELAGRIRQRPRAPRLFALTGYGQEHDAARSRAAGFEVHLVKPVPLEDLAQLLRSQAAEER